MRIFLRFVFWIAPFAFVLGSKLCTTKLGLDGICKPITECDYITNLLNLGDLGDLTPCDSDGSVGVFCCPAQNNTTESIYCRSCQKIIDLKARLTPNLKTYNENSTKISIAELPHMVQVLFPEKGFVGAGVLISERFVLTAAHLVFIRRSLPICRLGKTTLDESDEAVELDLKVKQIIPHELYQPREVYYDIALLLLEKNVKFYNHIWPACLKSPSMKLNDDTILTLSGWKQKGFKTNALIKSNLNIVVASECQKFYSGREYEVSLPDGIEQKSLVCARNVGCQGSQADSDGPLYYYTNNTFFIYAFATSTNTNCGSESPGIYTEVEDVLEWIERIIL